MKIYHKNVVVLLSLVAMIFGAAGYFSYSGLQLVQEHYANRTGKLLGLQYKNYIDTWFETEIDSSWNETTHLRFREHLQTGSGRFQDVEGIALFNHAGNLIFSSGLLADSLFERFGPDQLTVSRDSTLDFNLFKDIQNEGYIASWRTRFHPDFLVFTQLDPLQSLQPIVHGMAIRFYLLGIAGIFCAVIFAGLTSRIAKEPMKTLNEVLTYIKNRKYGFRLKPAKDHEFYDEYITANDAIRRMEQIDSAQRTAVRRRTIPENEMKTITRFMDMLAHEVKNPLHAFGLNLDVLRTKIEKNRQKDETLKHVNILEKESQHLQEVVHGFLDYLRPGVPRKEKLNVNPVIKEVCEGISREAENGKIKIETRLGRKIPDIFIDKRQFQQALHNVIINAIHATGSGGRISIRTWLKRKRVLVSVRDTGEGIDKEQLKKIFELYFTTKRDGSGLGLPITKRIVEANGGEMQIESQVGKGTTLTFMFNSVRGN